MHVFTVDESKWQRGQKVAGGRIDGKLCIALYFANNYEEQGVPFWPTNKYGIDNPSGGMHSLFDLNDDTTITDDERKAKLIEIFAAANMELRFVNGTTA